MKFKKLFIFIFAIILVFSSCNSLEVSGEYDIPDYSDCEEQIGILAWCAPGYGPPPAYNLYKNPIQWKWVGEAGYNIVMPLTVNFNSPNTMSSDQLDWAYEAGLKMIVCDTAMSNSRIGGGAGLNVPSDNKNTHLYKDHPGFYGIYICDEPSPGNWKFANDRMAECKEEFGDDIILFVNHCFDNSYAALDIQYQDLFDVIPNTNVLSYDGYCMMDDGTVKATFLSDAAITRYFAKRNGVLSCNFILTSGGYDRYRICSEEDIRWQTNVMLAYGYDIIGHFTYEPFSTSEWVINQQTMERTDLYYRIQKVNLEVRAIEKIYKSFEWQGTAIAFGEEKDTEDLCESVFPNFREESIPGIEKIESTQNVLCGIFKDKNQNMGYMLTNAINPFKEIAAEAKVIFDNAAYKGVLVIDKNYAEIGWTIIDLNKAGCSNKGSFTITLEPGEGKFIIPLKYK